MSRFGIIGSINAIAVEKAWLCVRQITVPDIIRAFGQKATAGLILALIIEQTKFHLVGMG
jgi:hypothetical protein